MAPARAPSTTRETKKSMPSTMHEDPTKPGKPARGGEPMAKGRSMQKEKKKPKKTKK